MSASRSSSQTATTDSTSSSGTAALGARGQWGGLILLGNAPTSAPLTSQIEGITGYTYGGTDPMDSSGMLRYVRVWHGGAVIGADNEINGITFGGVGAGTVVSHCEVAFNADDGFEFFGGTVNVKYLSVLFGGDDSFDSDQGYQGMGQFLFTMMGSQGDHAFEMDSEVSSGVTGNTKDSMPRSHPQFYSYTSLGGGASGRSGEAMHVNDGTGGKFGNAVIAHTTGNGLNFQDCGTISYTSVLPASTVNIGMGAAGTTSSAGYFYFSANNMVSVGGTVYNNGDPTDCTNLNGLVTPVTSAPAFVSVSAATLDYTNLPATFNPLPASGSNMCSALDTPQTDVNAFYDTVTCKGAFASPTDNWLAGWSWLDCAGKLAGGSCSGLPTAPLAALSSTVQTIRSSVPAGGLSLVAGVSYLLSSQLSIQSGASLTIAAGTTIYAMPPLMGGVAPAIIIEKGATIQAVGTASLPITMTTILAESALNDPSVVVTDSSTTSGQATPLGARGKWGGLILLGNAPTNVATTTEVEGITGRSFGGTNPNDNSGSLSYVRVWHGGAVIGADNEINGITFAGVGAGTAVSHCEVAYNADDGFEVARFDRTPPWGPAQVHTCLFHGTLLIPPPMIGLPGSSLAVL